MKSGIGKAVEVLNKLLKINIDRIECYQKAEEKTLELNLKTIFRNMADESKKNASDLTREIERSGGNIISTPKRSNVWMDLKSIFSGKDRQSILDSCESGEENAQAAYTNAISVYELTMKARQLVRNQQIAWKILFDIIMTFRDGRPVYIPIF
jgi:uncharacterized protein (TIGR02284 family)